MDVPPFGNTACFERANKARHVACWDKGHFREEYFEAATALGIRESYFRAFGDVDEVHISARLLVGLARGREGPNHSPTGRIRSYLFVPGLGQKVRWYRTQGFNKKWVDNWGVKSGVMRDMHKRGVSDLVEVEGKRLVYELVQPRVAHGEGMRGWKISKSILLSIYLLCLR